MKKGANTDRNELKIGRYKLLTGTEKLLALAQDFPGTGSIEKLNRDCTALRHRVTSAIHRTATPCNHAHSHRDRGRQGRQQPDGSKGIDTSELIRVFGPLQQETSQARKTAHHETDSNTALLQSHIEALERENELLRRELADAKNEKDRLLGLLEQRLLTGAKEKHRRKGKKKG